MMAARAGAAQVVTCEVNPAVASHDRHRVSIWCDPTDGAIEFPRDL